MTNDVLYRSCMMSSTFLFLPHCYSMIPYCPVARKWQNHTHLQTKKADDNRIFSLTQMEVVPVICDLILEIRIITWPCLTHWGQDKMAAILQPAFSHAFSWMKIYEFHLRFHWNVFPKVSINNIPALAQIMAWRQPCNKPLSEPMVVSLRRHIWVS